jgi:hypothetical protein
LFLIEQTAYLFFESRDHVGWSSQIDVPMQHPDSTIVDIAVGLLFPAAPNSLLGRMTAVPKSTARSWRRRRRPPMAALRLLRAELQRRGAECFSTLRELEILIAKREGEPPHRRGFMEIRERDGPGSVPRDGRNRRGRPTRTYEL